MKTYRGLKRRRLSAEFLEDRSLLAGNVLVSVEAGVLKLVGDAASNQVQILPAGTDRYSVLGLAGTKVNGKLTPQTFSATGLCADLKGGDDVLNITNVKFKGNADIYTGLGIDVVSIANSEIVGNTNIITCYDKETSSPSIVRGVATTSSGPDKDQVVLANSKFGTGLSKSEEFPAFGNLNIVTGGDNDNVSLGKVTVCGSLYISTNDGNDNVALGVVEVGGNTSIDTAGCDYYAPTKLQASTSPPVLPSDIDTVTIDVSKFGTKSGDDSKYGPTGNLDINTGRDLDAVTITNTQVKNAINVYTGSGDDVVTVANVLSKFLCIYTEAGKDTVTISAVAVDMLLADLGCAGPTDGGNILTIAAVVSANTHLEGGGGTGDRLTRTASSLGTQVIAGWEILV